MLLKLNAGIAYPPEYAHQHDVTVEGELGVLAGVEDEVSSDHHTYTDPEEVIELELLHVVEVERGDSISASDGLLEHLAGVNKAESLIICHHGFPGESVRKTPMESERPPRPSENSASITGMPRHRTQSI